MPSEIKRTSLAWLGDLRFEGGEPQGPSTRIDGDNREAPGPMLTLLLAAASCSGADVVSILQKMRVRLQSFRIEAAGTRREEEPRRYTAMHLTYHLGGEGLDETKARRAIELSIAKYCSVMHSLDPDLRITYELRLRT
ncbi:MAG: OsmC family protein [Gemmatimonadales bacterium]